MEFQRFPQCYFRNGDSIMAKDEEDADRLEKDGWRDTPNQDLPEKPGRPARPDHELPDRPEVSPEPPERPVAKPKKKD